MFALSVSGAALMLSLWNLFRISRAMRCLEQCEAQLQADLRRARAMQVRK